MSGTLLRISARMISAAWITSRCTAITSSRDRPQRASCSSHSPRFMAAMRSSQPAMVSRLNAILSASSCAMKWSLSSAQAVEPTGISINERSAYATARSGTPTVSRHIPCWHPGERWRATWITRSHRAVRCHRWSCASKPHRALSTSACACSSV
jgi:hypothetical protein